MSDIEWYIADLVDEVCPPAKKSPQEYILMVGEHYEAGYAADDKSVMDEDREGYNRGIIVGEVLDFITCERLGDIEATLRRDGTFDLHGQIPQSHNVVVVNNDSDLLYQSFEDLIDAIKKPDVFSDPADMIFEGSDDSARVTLSFADWSDALPHIFEIVDGKPVFTPVPEKKQ